MDSSRGFPVKKKILLIFAKLPRAGGVKTRLCPPLTLGQSAELYGAMLQDVLELTARVAGIERWLCYAPEPTAAAYFHALAPAVYQYPQAGCDLGERLANAFTAAFAAGADQVVVIGSDAPNLPPVFIEQAFSLGGQPDCDAVFGPTSDGGYYLLGMRRVWPELFAGISWSTATVLRESLARAAASDISTTLLPEWRDIDTADDLEHLAAQEAGTARHTRQRLRELGLWFSATHPPGSQPPPGEPPPPGYGHTPWSPAR